MILSWLRKWTCDPASSINEETFSSQTEQVEEEEELQEDEDDREDPDDVKDLCRIFAKHISGQQDPGGGGAGGRIHPCVLHVLFSHTYVLVMQPVFGSSTAFEDRSPCGNDSVYCLLQPLIPGCTHAFCLTESIMEKQRAVSRLEYNYSAPA